LLWVFPAGDELWVGGLFLGGSGKWVWDTLIDAKTNESTPFSTFAIGLFKGGFLQPPSEFVEFMTYYTMIDKYSGRLESAEPTITRRFVCEVSQKQ